MYPSWADIEALDQEAGLVIRVVAPCELDGLPFRLGRQPSRRLRRLLARRVAYQRISACRRKVRRQVLVQGQAVISSKRKVRTSMPSSVAPATTPSTAVVGTLIRITPEGS